MSSGVFYRGSLAKERILYVMQSAIYDWSIAWTLDFHTFKLLSAEKISLGRDFHILIANLAKERMLSVMQCAIHDWPIDQKFICLEGQRKIHNFPKQVPLPI